MCCIQAQMVHLHITKLGTPSQHTSRLKCVRCQPRLTSSVILQPVSSAMLSGYAEHANYHADTMITHSNDRSCSCRRWCRYGTHRSCSWNAGVAMAHTEAAAGTLVSLWHTQKLQLGRWCRYDTHRSYSWDASVAMAHQSQMQGLRKHASLCQSDTVKDIEIR